MAKHNHGGHRKRMKKRLWEDGLDGFHDHEVLEVLLYFSIPQKNTNEIAHVLLERFGSLSNVLEADVSELLQVKGIGEHSATFIHMIPELFRVYERDKNRPRKLLDRPEAWGEFAKTLFIGHTVERFYLICLDTQYRLIHAPMIREGTIDEVLIYPRDALEAALRHKAKNVILAHNHPGGSLTPTLKDMELTEKLSAILEAVGINVVDHVIVANGQYVSLGEKGLIHG